MTFWMSLKWRFRVKILQPNSWAITLLLKGGEAGAGILEFGDAGIGILPER